jgi:hypothetical protein
MPTVDGRSRVMPESLSSSYVRVRGLEPDVTFDRLTLSRYRFEYVGPLLWIPEDPSVVAVSDFSLSNRGSSDESFAILQTEFKFAQDQPVYATPGTVARAGRSFLVNWALPYFNSPDDEDAGQGYWAHIFTTSRDVVPSIHFYVVDAQTGSVVASYPEFYVSPGDFAVFELPLELPSGISPVLGNPPSTQEQ